MIRKLLYKTTFLLCVVTLVVGCKEEEYAVPVPKSGLQNDCIKKSVGPGLAGIDMEFMYAMAIQQSEGKLISAQVEASIPGAPETYLEHRSFHTDAIGDDIGIPVATPSVTDGAVTKVTFDVDTNAATLRYYYRPTPDAADKEVSFTFSATSSNGQTVTYKMGPYKIRRMEVAPNLAVSNGNKFYISIEDMAVYDDTEATARPDKIDVLYLFRTITGITFGHSFVAPAADVMYRPGITLPNGINRNTKIQKAWNVRDIHLGANAGTGNNSYVYLDDEDFKTLDLSAAPNYAINMLAQSGIWVETADGKYRGYIYVNSINANGSAVIGIKRYRL
ncbi:DUF4466 domain-containing protein [Sphingobacterium phlebotomi]|uniref:DUF4466 domain-containing protein n=1 Tax=Sphingobacterium phlebotomi TaxID=2605433 RepID=A0A5D4HDP7_9SPHI|nr:DUF4466 family protein [Sphingobacterium phlebotomi]TYR36940.1 DUF4466 domain-containing protein [Sphingobacterium phlebotomi]